MPLTGLSAFPLTPHRGGVIDDVAFDSLVRRVATAGVDSIGALGSTGAYAYLEREDRGRLARRAVEAAGGVPVVVGVGAVATSAVLRHVEDAVRAGVAGVLLAPVSYQPLRGDEVFGLYETVADRFPETPIVVYDNPATTGFVFSDDLIAAIAQLPAVESVKLGALAADPAEARSSIAAMRDRVPERVTIGISGDGQAVRGLLAGCDVWYSVIAGIFPERCVAITRAALAGDAERATALSDEFAPVWAQFAEHGSFRVAAALATLTGLTTEDAVLAPVRPLADAERDAVARARRDLG